VASALGIATAAVYYPSIEDGITLNNQIPILFLSGQEDDVTRAADLEALVRDRSSSAGVVTLHVYPGAHHGFDVASLTKRRTIRLLPLIGPKATLQYDEASATDAEKRLVAFLADNTIQRTR
jgi:dienelactone hydrolase